MRVVTRLANISAILATYSDMNLKNVICLATYNCMKSVIFRKNYKKKLNIFAIFAILFFLGDMDSLSAGNAGHKVSLHIKCLLILATFLFYRVANCDQLTDVKT